MKNIQLICDLKIQHQDLDITVLSDEHEIAIAIEGEQVPKLDIPLRKAFNMYKELPFSIEQKVSVVFNKKEIYRSDKSLLKRYNAPFFIRLLFKNAF